MKINFCFLIFFISLTGFMFPQSRIKYNNNDIFLNGSNMAWVNFASDIGHGTTDLTTFNKFFAELKAAGGNSFRLWLHTNGTVTPEFDQNGYVIGPGAGAIDDLKQILDLANQNEIGLLLCLWSHDMMRASLPVNILNRNQKLLTDTTAMHAYINNALIPMVGAVKGHPAIIAWEIFNEPEGFTEVGNWGDWKHVKQSDVQKIVNLIAGAIHRTDPSAKVTNGSWSLTAQVDIPTLAKSAPGALLNSMTSEEKLAMENEVKMIYGMNLSAEEIIKEFYKPNAVNINYYRDDRLIAAGGDPLGTLDFYTAHYYTWAGTALSPFHHPYSYWKLDKPLAIAEFFMTESFGVPYQDLYRQLFSTGYAGALSWQWWNDTGSDAYDLNHARTVAAVHDLYINYPEDVDAFSKSGKIYSFTAAPSIIEKGDSSLVTWKTASGSIVTLDGESVTSSGSKYLKPVTGGTHKLETQGDLPSTQSITINLYPSGNIFSFIAIPGQILEGGKCLLKWNVSNGSAVTLNGTIVNAKDSIEVSPKISTEYTLSASGDVSQTKKVTVFVLPADQINWALYKSVTVSSSEGNGENDNPLFAVDGDESTRWSSAYSDQQWLTIDLKDTLQLNYILLDWSPYYAKTYLAGISLDGKNYTTIYSTSNGQGGFESIENNGMARFIKFLFNKRSDESNGYSLWEIEIYGVPSSTVDVKDETHGTPDKFSLSPNYPNPFNPVTTIKYSIPEKSFVTLEVFNLLGVKVTELVNEIKTTGEYQVTFDGSNLSSGVYYYRLKTGKFIKTGKMVLLR